MPRHLDLEALDTYLSLNYVPGTQTLIEGIQKVAPGHLLEWRQRDDCAAKRGGSCRRARQREISRRRRKEELDGLLRDSVREHLISDVPLGVWASGGLDSSAILHYAAAQTARAAEDVLGFVSRGGVSTRARTSGRSREATARTITNSI